MATEKRLIDANVTEKVMNERYDALVAEYGHYDHYTTGYGDALCVVEDAPTVDAVEVVRCRNCQNSDPCKPYNKVWCPKIGRYMNADAFCSEGVKKDG